jgi:hypothetical protein
MVDSGLSILSQILANDQSSNLHEHSMLGFLVNTFSVFWNIP